MKRLISVALACVLFPLSVTAQDDARTLADIRQELTVFNVEIQKLKRELSTTGGAQGQSGGGTLLDRVDAIERALQRLTGKTEELEFRIQRIVKDGTNRIGDLEFRLVELEGGDLSALGETSTLGGIEEGEAQPVVSSANLAAAGEELATHEAADFERAAKALEAGKFQAAATQFEAFNQTYPNGPLSIQADLKRGEALDKMGDTRAAARAYLDAFSADQKGKNAARALYLLGSALGNLGQTQEACVTLGEVSIRFPQSSQAEQANAQMQKIGCGG